MLYLYANDFIYLSHTCCVLAGGKTNSASLYPFSLYRKTAKVQF